MFDDWPCLQNTFDDSAVEDNQTLGIQLMFSQVCEDQRLSWLVALSLIVTADLTDKCTNFDKHMQTFAQFGLATFTKGSGQLLLTFRPVRPVRPSNLSVEFPSRGKTKCPPN